MKTTQPILLIIYQTKKRMMRYVFGAIYMQPKNFSDMLWQNSTQPRCGSLLPACLVVEYTTKKEISSISGFFVFLVFLGHTGTTWPLFFFFNKSANKSLCLVNAYFCMGSKCEEETQS